MTTQPDLIPSALARQAYRTVPLRSLARHPKNQRRGDVAAIVESIRVNGFFGACGVQAASQVLIWGNHRADAAEEAARLIDQATSGAWEPQGEVETRLVESWRSWPERFGGPLTELPIIDLDVDDDEAERILLADNATSDKASWDRPQLAEQLADIQERRGSLEGTGFGRVDLETLLIEVRAHRRSVSDGGTTRPIPDHLRGIEDDALKAPFPWFGGKRRVAKLAWAAFGEISNYVEPFAGSLAVLLSRPGGHGGRETINDLDGFVANFWRALRDHPEEVAAHADWPVIEADLHARAAVCSERRLDLIARLEGDPAFSDPELAGWWVWGVCASITEFPPPGPWERADGELRKRPNVKSQGISRELPNVVARGDADPERVGISRELPRVRDQNLNAGQPLDRGEWIREWFGELAYRLRDTVVCCGDWRRVTGDLVTQDAGASGVFLDPPYSSPDRAHLYLAEDFDVAHAVRDWAIEIGDDPRRRWWSAATKTSSPRCPPHGGAIPGPGAFPSVAVAKMRVSTSKNGLLRASTDG